MTATMPIIVPDEYPTRKRPTPRLIFRRDPAVWSAGAGPIDPETLAGYDRDGFLAIDELLTADEVDRCTAELDRLSSDDAIRSHERTVLDKTSGEVRTIYEVHKISELVATLVADERVAGRARQILGSDVYVHQSRINYRPGFDSDSLYWHSDFETWHAEDGMPAMRAVSISIALTENTPQNGCLMIMPGSHRTFVSSVGDAPADYYKQSLKEQQIGTPDQDSLKLLAERHGIAQFAGAPGSAVMFDCNCMHGSNGNITPYPRSDIFVVFNSVDNTPTEPYAADDRRPPFLASREYTPVR